MSNKNIWSYERYALALQGHEDIPSLRRAVSGFEPSDGYDLRKFHGWTPARKARVRDYYERIVHMLAQPRTIIRPRNKEIKDALQKAYHGEYASKSFKQVFIPYVPPIGHDGEIIKERITYSRHGIEIHQGEGSRITYLFDQYALAADSDNEVQRAVDYLEKKGASLFYIQCGMFQTLNGSDGVIIKEKVLKWVSQYDGVKSLPKGRHRGDAPQAHFYGDWLRGISGFKIGTDSMLEMQKKIREGMAQAKERNNESKRSIIAMVEVMRAMRKIKDKHTRFDFEIMLKNSPHDRETLNIFKREIAKVTRRQNKK
jgi:hypothetical protein